MIKNVLRRWIKKTEFNNHKKLTHFIYGIIYQLNRRYIYND